MGDKLSFVSENLCVGSEGKGFFRLEDSCWRGDVILMGRRRLPEEGFFFLR